MGARCLGLLGSHAGRVAFFPVAVAAELTADGFDASSARYFAFTVHGDRIATMQITA